MIRCTFAGWSHVFQQLWNNTRGLCWLQLFFTDSLFTDELTAEFFSASSLSGKLEKLNQCEVQCVKFLNHLSVTGPNRMGSGSWPGPVIWGGDAIRPRCSRHSPPPPPLSIDGLCVQSDHQMSELTLKSDILNLIFEHFFNVINQIMQWTETTDYCSEFL